MISMIKSIAIYGMFFVATLAFVMVAENELKHKKRFPFYVVSFFALLIPCVLAGLRADTVGTDVKVYADPIFRAAAQRSFSEIHDFYTYVEVGYRALALLVSRVTNELGVFLAISEFAIILPIYIVAYKRRSITPMWVTIALYLCLFYCASFNLMRQCISAALLLLALQYYEEKKYNKMLLCIVVGFTFHSSILIGIAVYAVSYFITKFKKLSTQWLAVVGMAIVAVAVFSSWSVVLSWAIDNGILPEKYNTYLTIFNGTYGMSQSYYFELTTSNYIEVGYRLLFAMIGILFATQAVRRGYARDIMMHITAVIICALVELMTMVVLHSSYGLRIVWNNEFSLLLMLPALLQKRNIALRRTNLRVIAVVLSVVSFFAIGFIVLGWHGVTPFEFRI